MRMFRALLCFLVLVLILCPVQAQTNSAEENSIQSIDSKGQESEGEADTAAPTRGRRFGPQSSQMKIGGDEGFGLGTALPDPTALFGPTRIETVLQDGVRASTYSITGHYIQKLSENQSLILEGNLDPFFVGADLSYSWQPEGTDGMWNANFQISSARFAPFNQTGLEVQLPNLRRPMIQQSGVGVEYIAPLSETLRLAVGANYQSFGFSDELIGGTRWARDFTGTPLALGLRGSGDIFALRMHGVFSDLDDQLIPTEGTRVRLGLEQGLELGGQSTSYSRLALNAAHLMKVPGFNDGDHSLLLNFQLGTSIGQVPNVRGFHLGGPSSVRGFEPGEMASGDAFIQGTVEYRHHLTDFSIFDYDVDLRGVLFADYGSVMGTQTRLLGIPEFLWDKPADALGYGAGLQFATDVGLFKVEAAWNNRGGQAITFSIGERF